MKRRCSPSFEHIAEIDEERFEKIRKMLYSETCTQEHRLQWDKHYFQHHFIENYSELLQQETIENISSMFVAFRKQNNVLLQKKSNKAAELAGVSTQDIIFQGNQSQQLTEIQRICRLLALNNSWQVDAVIPRDIIEGAAEELLKQKPRLVTIFGLRQREDINKTPKSPIERASKIVNQVLSVWGHTKIATVGKQQRAAGKTVTPYSVQGDIWARYV